MATSFPEAMTAHPTVFALHDTYQIFIPFSCEVIVSVRVGGELFYDDANGMLRSGTPIHRVEIPMELLDAERSYTLIYRRMIERKPYFPTSEEPVELTYAFRPVPDEGPVHIYHISDAHNLEEPVIEAGRYFGRDLDLLVLNGDIPNHSGQVENFGTIYRLASALTEGEIPVVFSRGNHDTRGICAERFGEYTPTENGRTYYTFRLGSLWGMVLDCGEDKVDSSEEYGHTVCFHSFRRKETEWIRRVIANAKDEYLAMGVKRRLLISHIPFSYILPPPFDIEQELYAEWCRLLREYIRPDLALHGHLHKTLVWLPGGENDHLGQPCPAIIGSKPTRRSKESLDAVPYFIGAAITLSGRDTHVTFNGSDGTVFGEFDL